MPCLVSLEQHIARGIKALQLIRIQVPLALGPPTALGTVDEDAWEGSCAPHPITLQCQNTLNALKEFRQAHGPFVATATDEGAIQLVCPKACAGKLFKLLHAQQKQLGIRVTDAKSHLSLSSLSDHELAELCTATVHDGLEAAGWWRLEGSSFLGTDAMAAADGRAHTCAAVQVRVQLQSDTALVLRVQPSVVRFRHPALLPPGGADGTLVGSICRVLPGLTPAVVVAVRFPQPAEARLLHLAWTAAGFTLPAKALAQVVDVRFEEDEDAPTRAFPPCCVLSQLGLDLLHDRVDSLEVQAVLARLRDAVATVGFGVFAPGQLSLVRAMDLSAACSAPPAHCKDAHDPPPVMQTARQLMAAGAPPAVQQPQQGVPLNVASFHTEAAGGGGESGGTAARRAKKPHAHAGPQLLSFLKQMEEQEAHEAAAAPLKLPTTTTPAARLPAGGIMRRGALPTFKKAAAKRPAAAHAIATGAAQRPPAKKPTAAATGNTAAGNTAAAPAAKPRAKPAAVDVAALGVPALAAGGTLGSLTIPQLKAYCKSEGLPVGGKKADLEQRVKSHLGMA